jgi:DNA-binding NarL/FixJ family response regulator
MILPAERRQLYPEPGWTREAMKKIRIILADDHVVVRQGIRVLLEQDPDITVVGEAENGRQAVQLAAKLMPDVVVLDLAMPLLNGLEATRQIVQHDPKARVLVLSSYGDREYVDQLIAAGATGYLLKQTAADNFIKAVRQASESDVFFSPTIYHQLSGNAGGDNQAGRRRKALAERMASYLDMDVQKAPHERLSDREFLILRMIASGKAVSQIAKELSLSVKTISTYRARVLEKMDMKNNAELTHYAMQKALVE